MSTDLVMIGEGLLTISRVLLEIGAALVFAGMLTSFVAIVFTWAPRSVKRRAVAKHRQELIKGMSTPSLTAARVRQNAAASASLTADVRARDFAVAGGSHRS